jgi:hypothetical protein
LPISAKELSFQSIIAKRMIVGGCRNGKGKTRHAADAISAAAQPRTKALR